MLKADLHLHTTCSDGLLSPEEVIQAAAKKKLDIISITDHDNISCYENAKAACDKAGIGLIFGIELSSTFQGREVHILGYNMDKNLDQLTDYLKEFNRKRIERLGAMTEKLNKLGLKITAESVLEEYPKNITIGRPHLAKQLIKKGYAKNYKEAFSKYIGDYRYGNVKKENPEAGAVMELINSCGGKSFIAHPGKTLPYESLAEIVKLGLDGIETKHPSHSETDTKNFNIFARRYKLIKSGGSDFHGMNEYEKENFGKYYITDEEEGTILNSETVKLNFLNKTEVYKG